MEQGTAEYALPPILPLSSISNGNTR